jgi:hypothetical protein
MAGVTVWHAGVRLHATRDAGAVNPDAAQRIVVKTQGRHASKRIRQSSGLVPWALK